MVTIPIIIDKKAKSQKLINNRPGYDMKYAESYIYKYCGINDYQRFFDELFEIERQYNTLSVIRPLETLKQWAIRVRVPLQELVSEKKRSLYHVHCLYGGFGNSKLVNHDYYRPRIHKANVAICLDCMKLIHVDNVKPKKIYASALYRYIEKIVPSDLMISHWDNECDKPKTDFGRARVIQRAYKRFKERVPSNAHLTWNSLPNDGTPDDKKFLTLIPHKIKNPIPLDRIKMRLNKDYVEYIKKYNRYPFVAEDEIRTYKEYITPYDWIGRKKTNYEKDSKSDF
ncbi:hypothetical protein Glove_216g31 [Diversispora epigaea]|uniref:Uncharacterized protein n=1 Tax=Diversispora epigaea TaxID=1348612 RepID=A0A397IH06_9GLOM|nr:hypothetical protein Glove_216g31 [Diversispora epigaea]